MNGRKWGALATAVLLGGPLLAAACTVGETGEQRWITIVVLVLGAAFGWLVGTVLSPYNTTERAEFSAYTKAFTAFASGYGAAKIDASVEALLDPSMLFQPLVGLRVAGLFAAFLIALLVTFVFRSYDEQPNAVPPAAPVAEDG